MRIKFTAWIAAASLASPVLALDATSEVVQPPSLAPSMLAYESYYSPEDESLPSEPPSVPAPSEATEPAPIHIEPAEPVAEANCAEPAPLCYCNPRCTTSCSRGGGCCLFGDCNLGDPCTLQDRMGCDSAITFGGWTQLGYHSEPTPLSMAYGEGLSFNDVPNQINLQQQWLWFEKVADGSNGLDWGFRFDVMYGTDASKTQAFGNDNARWDFADDFNHGVYGFAMPQAYLEVAAGDFSVIAGHFFTLVGYEVVPAPDNFFYSHALTMFNSEPFTHTGVLGTYSGFENVEFYGGWTLGWDTGFDQAAGGSSWLGGFSATLTDDVTFTYISTWGNFGKRSATNAAGDLVPGLQGDGYSHSLVFDFTLSDNLNYVFQSDLVDIDDAAGQVTSNDQVGINQYLFYNLNDCSAVGTRFEWWKSDGQSYYEWTAGLNYRPHANVILRPEIRHDWTPAGYANGTDAHTTFGVDCIFTY